MFILDIFNNSLSKKINAQDRVRATLRSKGYDNSKIQLAMNEFFDGREFWKKYDSNNSLCVAVVEWLGRNKS
ncbi:MAG: hypothetical protein Ta2E_06810 [Mycoplasmoidaceae bacterium]|nr:MAG: hypothetical protein Ta2E_06810 [Mycoplasmoidaceae bacterium]